MKYKIRDRRDKGWFYLDNEYLNGYAKIFGAIGTSIYTSLCRHADNESQKCFPAIELISEELDISRNTVTKYIKLFEAHHLVFKEQRRAIEGKKGFSSNIYWLLDKDEWIKDLTRSMVVPAQHAQPLSSTRTTGDIQHAQPLGNKETHREGDSYKETHLVADATIPFSFEEELEKLKNSNRKDMKIIALYWVKKKYRFENRDQFTKALKRELRPASMLIGYSGREIGAAINYCREEYNDKVPWTLETVGKRVADIVNIQH